METSDLMEKLVKWNKIKKEIQELQLQEYDLREQLALEALGDKTHGSKTTKFGTVKVQAQAVWNYSVDRGELDLIKDLLSPEEEAAIDYKPTIRPARFEKLEQEAYLRDAVKVSKGKYQFKIVEDLA